MGRPGLCARASVEPMNLQQFLDHWKIAENPFRGEEARQDSVFVRIGLGSSPESLVLSPESSGGPSASFGAVAAGFGTQDSVTQDARRPSAHSDFDKILGDLSRPSTSIVFGEKGSGKTAIRLQIADRIAAHNARNPGTKPVKILAVYIVEKGKPLAEPAK